MQSADGVERRGHCAFLPSAEKGSMLARQRNPPVYAAHIIVMFGAGIGAPHAKAAHGKWYPMPGHGDAVIELLVVLRMDLAAVLEDLLHPFLRRHGGELHCVQTPDVGAEQHAFTAALKS